ncbi:MAG: undecaprenyl-phosphate glucose phosphotransferase [Pirellulaceae bacterium]
MSETARSQIRPITAWTRPVHKLLDCLAIVIGLYILVTWAPEANSRSTIVVGLVAIGLFSLAAELVGLYRDWQGLAIERELGAATLTWLIALSGLALLGQFTEYTTEISSGAILVWLISTPVVGMAQRIMFRHYLVWHAQNAMTSRGFAVVGANDLGVQLVRNVQTRADMGLRFMGFFDDRPEDRTNPLPEDVSQRLGNINTLIEQARSGKVPVVFITLPLRAENRIREIIQRLADTTCSVYLVPDFFVFQLLHSRWTDIQGLPAVSVYENPFYGVDGVFKRICDMVLASIALVAAAIPMAIIALLVKLTSKGPVLFKQKRYGLDGKEIWVWKFRSMRTLDNGPVVKQATQDDPRITRIGAILRRTSLDELPQLFNVLQGTMSMVGPRPHASAHNEFYRKQIDGYMLRHKVKPGITGLAQVNGCRGETEQIEKMEKRIHFDHKYIREWSLWLDLKIIFSTFQVVLSRQNAY